MTVQLFSIFSRITRRVSQASRWESLESQSLLTNHKKTENPKILPKRLDQCQESRRILKESPSLRHRFRQIPSQMATILIPSFSKEWRLPSWKRSGGGWRRMCWLGPRLRWRWRQPLGTCNCDPWSSSRGGCDTAPAAPKSPPSLRLGRASWLVPALSEAMSVDKLQKITHQFELINIKLFNSFHFNYQF